MTNDALPVLITFLRGAFRAGDMPSSRPYVDVFSDRLMRACVEPTLDVAMEQLLKGINASIIKIHPPDATRMMAIAPDDAAALLAWLRKHIRLAALLASTRDEDLLEETVAGVVVPPIREQPASSGGTGPAPGKFAIGLTATCLSPLSHGADGKAGNMTLFRRQDVIASDGAMMSIPFYAGNAVRGQIRDLLADHFFTTLQIRPVLWFFYAAYSGGALEEGSAALKGITKALGDHGSLRTEGIREFRIKLPFLSLLGCALGNRVLSGRCQISDLRPQCKEWGTGEIESSSLLAWEYLTRREDDENHETNHSMIAQSECLKSGTVLTGGVSMDVTTRPEEAGALGLGLKLLAERAMLGGSNRMGFGRVALNVANCPDPMPYLDHLKAKADEIRAYLRAIGAIDEVRTAECTL